jgi:biotin carboxyl carrier protein
VTVVEEGLVEVSRGAGRKRFGLADPLRHRLRRVRADSLEASGEEEIRSAMPGRIVEVRVARGTGSPCALLLVLEAMKMQNEIRARAGGAVIRVSVSPGEAVESGAPLLALSCGPII